MSMRGSVKMLTALISIAAAVIFTDGLAVAGSTSMAPFGRTSQPIGHFNLCKQYPAECSVRSPFTMPEKMTETLLAQLSTVNAMVNAAVKPMEDIDIFGKEEVWTYPARVGDCEDYVLEKRRILARTGIPLANLLITVVRQSNGAGHAVLTVRTEIGDFILDNLSPDVLAWNHTGYQYVKRQSAWDTGKWVSIREGDAPMVGSVH